MNRLNELCPELKLKSIDIKVQYNDGNGGCFPMHFDTTPQVSQRQLTGVVYLNPNWKEEDGGQLRVYPFPYDKVDIAPKMDRMVLFCSHQMLHRVLPSKAPRYCLTLWFYSENPVPFPRKMPLGQYDQVLGFLLQPNNRKIFAKLVFAQDWASSIIESFGETEQSKSVVENHWKEIADIEKQLNPELISLLKTYLPLAHE